MFSKLFKKAFTLIEISVVLIVLSILIGSALISRNLLNRVKVSSAVTEFVQMKKAISIFKDTYNLLPGDVSQQEAQIFPDLWAYNADSYYARVPKIASIWGEQTAFAADANNAFYSAPSGTQASQTVNEYSLQCQRSKTTYTSVQTTGANAAQCGGYECAKWACDSPGTGYKCVYNSYSGSSFSMNQFNGLTQGSCAGGSSYLGSCDMSYVNYNWITNCPAFYANINYISTNNNTIGVSPATYGYIDTSCPIGTSSSDPAMTSCCYSQPSNKRFMITFSIPWGDASCYDYTRDIVQINTCTQYSTTNCETFLSTPKTCTYPEIVSTTTTDSRTITSTDPNITCTADETGATDTRNAEGIGEVTTAWVIKPGTSSTPVATVKTIGLQIGGTNGSGAGSSTGAFAFSPTTNFPVQNIFAPGNGRVEMYEACYAMRMLNSTGFISGVPEYEKGGSTLCD
ncbi:MAG: hypothetical protein RL208_96, partial [Pseudomonadota bacterium]